MIWVMWKMHRRQISHEDETREVKARVGVIEGHLEAREDKTDVILDRLTEPEQT